MKKIALLLVAFAFSLSIAQAQGDDKSKKDKSTKTTTETTGDKTVVDFSTGKKANIEESAESGYKNVIWLEAASLLSGYVSAGYERAIAKNLSIEIAAGPAFPNYLGGSLGDNFVMGLFQIKPNTDDAYWTSKDYRQLEGTQLFGTSSSGSGVPTTGGFYALVEPKYYPNDDVFEGFFLAGRLQYTSRTYTIAAPDMNAIRTSQTDSYYSASFASLTEKTNRVYNTFDFVPHLGWNSQLGRVVFDYEGGVGVRLSSITGYDIGYKGTSTTGYTYELRNSHTETAVLPVFTAAFKLGFIF